MNVGKTKDARIRLVFENRRQYITVKEADTYKRFFEQTLLCVLLLLSVALLSRI